MPQRSAAAPSLVRGRAPGEAEAGGLTANSTLNELADRARTAALNPHKTPCPFAKPSSLAWNDRAGFAVEIPCGSWGCRVCGFRKRSAAAFLISSGIVEADQRGERCRFLTLTEDPRNKFESVAAMSKSWNHFRTLLKRRELLDQYVLGVEHTTAGRPHLHAVTTGSFIPQRKLSEIAAQAGFGRVSDIRAVKMVGKADDIKTAGYIAKELAGYIAKDGSALAWDKAKRRRPLRCSRDWSSVGGLRGAEAELRRRYEDAEDYEPLPGSWFYIYAPNPQEGRITVRGSDDLGSWTLTAEAFGEADLTRPEAKPKAEDEDAAQPKDEDEAKGAGDRAEAGAA